MVVLIHSQDVVLAKYMHYDRLNKLTVTEIKI